LSGEWNGVSRPIVAENQRLLAQRDIPAQRPEWYGHEETQKLTKSERKQPYPAGDISMNLTLLLFWGFSCVFVAIPLSLRWRLSAPARSVRKAAIYELPAQLLRDLIIGRKHIYRND
jgi:hypothetical protein